MTRLQRSTSGLTFLDGLRGLAAMYVMVGHARWLLWEGYAEGYLRHPSVYSRMDKVLMYLFSAFKYGHEAVLFFFVVSGFVIHLRYARRLADEGRGARFDWLSFMARRAKRLYPPLLAALAITMLCDGIGKSLGYAIYYQTTRYSTINQNVYSNTDLTTLFGNLMFLMNSYVPVFGSNGPLWSLKYEWWFYMFYPLFWWVSRRSMLYALAAMIMMYGASFYGELWPISLVREIYSAMLAWWLGVIVADVFAGRMKLRWESLIAVGVGCGGALIVASTGSGRDIGLGLIFMAVLAAGFRLQEKNYKLTLLDKLKPLGDMSYTLYVIHFPIMVIGNGWLLSRSPVGELPRHFGWALAGIVVTTAISYGLHFLIERPFYARAKIPPSVASHA